ncbi:GFA family protein [Hansschlegelia zhihuaiae]|uniref:GFA family protein n=1 Tax=Hansschlegelia zhihuaiae TaxID=405005 RepID=A0A4Q0MI89_9HYPH|nr:GFA family protein [Hansschlegelia zhihuaiae]RXF73268.1 GFA family protein [Hansschlegelia zhihuaiae]
MPITLKGSCRCGGVSFSVESSGPVPYQLCYCSICRKTAGGGGYAINLIGDSRTLKVSGAAKPAIYRAEIDDGSGRCELSSAERNFCPRCGSALWLYDPNWPDLVHPFASAIDSKLPRAPERTHLMLRFKPSWVEPDFGPNDRRHDIYPEESIEEWHRRHGLWLE